MVSDFSVLNVVENSNSLKPLIYKITGAWGNHEGSMLLWAEVLAAYGFLIAWFRARDAALKYSALSVLGLVQAGFLAFILLTSNPFLRVWPMPLDGDDLNPLLQDIGLALHPPTLYTGYVGFGVVFAFAVAGMLRNKIDADWARAVQPWILLPWSFLTLGIGAGAWWAYRELGWGGWWFWDPVENVSLLPWLSATALLHANMVLERRGQLARWVAALSILTFSLSLIGTFIVRSGLITSVHAFASDPTRGLFILGYILLTTGGALVIYGRSKFVPSPPAELLSRTGFILIGNLLLVTCAGTVLIAILYPVLLTLFGGEAISVGPHYFDATFLPLAAPLPILAALAPLMAWDHTGRRYLKEQLRALAPAAAVALLVCLALVSPPNAEALLGAAIGGFGLFGAARYLQRARQAKVNFLSPGGMRFLASFCAHTGVAVLVIGMTSSVLFRQMHEAPLVPDRPLHFGRYTLSLANAERRHVHNYISRRADFRVDEDGHYLTTLSPELRYYPVRATQTTEAAIYSTPWRDLYLVIGDADIGGSRIGVRMYVAPGQQLVWLGFLLGGLGGFLALAGAARRLKEAR
ncbi:MAG: heme lyase CcmF/NrfE family subunit [Alphaproteobacteria bacterium]